MIGFQYPTGGSALSQSGPLVVRITFVWPSLLSKTIPDLQWMSDSSTWIARGGEERLVGSARWWSHKLSKECYTSQACTKRLPNSFLILIVSGKRNIESWFHTSTLENVFEGIYGRSLCVMCPIVKLRSYDTMKQCSQPCPVQMHEWGKVKIHSKKIWIL